MNKPFHIELVETRKGCAICEDRPRYDVLLNGEKVDQLYYNLTGYVGTLPLPEGGKLHLGECSISRIQRQANALNREARQKGKPE
jgi:hypothetical protein